MRICQESPHVLDVGGWWKPLKGATHVCDILPYHSRAGGGWIGEGEERFSANTWSVLDICLEPLPYPDKFFDFVYCGQTLEDIRDPITVCKEMCRVGKSGMIEVPSMWIECQYGVDADQDTWSYPGYERHRWLVNIKSNHLLFIPKLVWLNGIEFLDRASSLRLREREELWTDCLEWTGSFGFSELTFSGKKEIIPILTEYFATIEGAPHV